MLNETWFERKLTLAILKRAGEGTNEEINIKANKRIGRNLQYNV